MYHLKHKHSERERERKIDVEINQQSNTTEHLLILNSKKNEINGLSITRLRLLFTGNTTLFRFCFYRFFIYLFFIKYSLFGLLLTITYDIVINDQIILIRFLVCFLFFKCILQCVWVCACFHIILLLFKHIPLIFISGRASNKCVGLFLISTNEKIKHIIK